MPSPQRPKQRLELLSQRSPIPNLRRPLLHLNNNPLHPSNQMAKTLLHNHHRRWLVANRNIRITRDINIYAFQ